MNKKKALNKKNEGTLPKAQLREDLSHLNVVRVRDLDEYAKANGYIPLEQVLQEINEKFGL